jgi:hypothetical protein
VTPYPNLAHCLPATKVRVWEEILTGYGRAFALLASAVAVPVGLRLVYLIAFLVAVNQFGPLLGEHGLLPVPLFVKQLAFHNAPSIFFLFPNDKAFAAAAWVGVFLSGPALAGVADRCAMWLSMPLWAGL